MTEKKRSCTVADYLSSHHPKLFEAVQNLCIVGTLNPRHGDGVTFVIPDDKTVDELHKASVSDDDAKLTAAVSTIKAHTIPMYLATVAEFDAVKDDVPNGLDQRLEIESASGGVVTLKNGTTFKPDPKFKAMPHKAGLSAVFVATGAIPTAGPASTKKHAGRPPRPAGKGRAGAVGSDEPDVAKVRGAICHTVESAMAPLVTRQTEGAQNPYLAAVLSLLDFLKKASPEAYERAVCTLDYSPYASFYLLVEPDSAAQLYLIDDELIAEWDRTRQAGAGYDPKGAMAAYESHLKAGQGMLQGDAAALGAAVDRARWTVQAHGVSRSMVPKAIKAAYDTLSSGNTVGGVAAFPANYASFLAAHPGYKAWQDEARYQINYLFTFLNANMMCHLHDFTEVTRAVHDCVMGSRTLVYSNPDFLANKLMSRDEFAAGPLTFLASGAFLYFPRVGATGGDDDDDMSACDKNARQVTAGPTTLGSCCGM